MLAAALAAGAYGIVASDIWRISAALSWWRLAALCLVSLTVTIVAVIVAHELWERSPDPRARAQVLLFNVTTALTVTIGIASRYAALVMLILAGAALVISTPVLAEALGRDSSPRDYITLAWFAASFGTIAGMAPHSSQTPPSGKPPTGQPARERKSTHEPDRSYLTSVSILNIGRYIAMMMIPTTTPTAIIISGSMIDVRDEIDASTSSS